jgi:hypothetical protein
MPGLSRVSVVRLTDPQIHPHDRAAMVEPIHEYSVAGYTRDAWRRHKSRSKPSNSTTERSTRRLSRKSSTIWMCYSSSTSIRRNNGSICAPRTPSNRPSPRFDSGRRSPRVQALVPPDLPWPTSSLMPHKHGGGRYAPHLVALVRAGEVFHKGKLLERPTDIAAFGAGTTEPATTGSEVA